MLHAHETHRIAFLPFFSESRVVVPVTRDRCSPANSRFVVLLAEKKNRVNKDESVPHSPISPVETNKVPNQVKWHFSSFFRVPRFNELLASLSL